MIIEVFLIVNDTANITEHFDWTVPRSSDDSFAVSHVDQINDGVVMCWEGLGFASVYDVEEVDVIVPWANLS